MPITTPAIVELSKAITEIPIWSKILDLLDDSVTVVSRTIENLFSRLLVPKALSR